MQVEINNKEYMISQIQDQNRDRECCELATRNVVKMELLAADLKLAVDLNVLAFTQQHNGHN